MKRWVRATAGPAIRLAVPTALLAGVLGRTRPRSFRRACMALLVAFWLAVYTRYRTKGRTRTAAEFDLLRTANWAAFTRHYNERVPTIEEEFDIWGEYHQHRHEMRYDLVAAEVRRHLRPGGRILDVGCGSVLVADRILDLPAHYTGIEFGGHHVRYAMTKLRSRHTALSSSLAQGIAESLPFADATMDVVVMSEVIEHLLRPEEAVWEVARVLRPGGVFIMTTNNASEMPLRSPLSHGLAWLEKAVGADVPSLISLRPWVWPQAVDRALLPEGSADIYLPHTHHIQAETRRMFAAAGLDTQAWSTFEFPPPQSSLAQWLGGKGEPGQRAVDALEWLARRTPIVRRLGCHLFMVATKVGAPVAAEPPPGVWPGPFSGDSVAEAARRNGHHEHAGVAAQRAH